MEMRYGPRKGHMGRRASLKREEPSPAEEEPYCVAIIHEDGSVEFRDP